MEGIFPGYGELPMAVEKLTGFFYFEFDDKFCDTPDSHEMWEMVYIDRGSCNIVAGDCELRLNQGEMYFHKPYEKHMLKIIPGVCTNVLILTFLSNSGGMMQFEDARVTASITTKQYISAIIHEAFCTYKGPFNKPDANNLEFLDDGRLWYGEESIRLRLELMLIELLRDSVGTGGARKKIADREIISDELCGKIIDYMNRNLYESLCIDTICETFSFSRSYVYKHFLAVCGCSPKEYFNRLRLKEAKRLIRETDMNFYEISDILNYSNPHYFSTCFKALTGMTPTEYKKSCM